MGDLRNSGLEDIADLRAYERERPSCSSEVFEAKRLRRVALGPIMSLVFENTLTIRYQIQEMARVEKLATDEQILDELKVYNPLIPDPGQLSATLFIELTDEASLREWLPKLVGIEGALVVEFGPGGRSSLARSIARGGSRRAAHPRRRDRFGALRALQPYSRPGRARSQPGPVFLASDHPELPGPGRAIHRDP